MTKSLNLGHSVDSNSLVDMSKSLAGFHLTTVGANKMHESTMDQVHNKMFTHKHCISFSTLEFNQIFKEEEIEVPVQAPAVVGKPETKAKSQPPPPPPPPPPPATAVGRQSHWMSSPPSQATPPTLPNRNPQPRFVPISSLEDVQVSLKARGKFMSSPNF